MVGGDVTYTFKSSGSCSPSGSGFGQGSRTKLILLACGTVALLWRRYSSNQSGMVSSRVYMSAQVVETPPRYTVLQPGYDSSDIITIILGGIDRVGASLDGGGDRGVDNRS